MNRQEAQRVLKRLREYNADPESLLTQAQDVYKQATEGFPVEQLSKFGEPVVTTQVAPSVGVQALLFKLSVVKFLIENAGDPEEQIDTGLNINITRLTRKED